MRTRFAALGVVLVLALAACGSSKEATVAKPIQGGMLREGLVQLGSADPAKAQTVSERQMADQLYDGLTAWSSTSYFAMPSLASSWEATPDQKVWTFHIRGDAKASNGEAVTSTDVKTSLERMADQLPGLGGIDAVDPTTVKISLDAPFGDLPLLLGNPSFGIVHYGSSTFTTGPFMVGSTPDASHVNLVKAPGSKANLDQIDVTYFADAGASYNAFQNKSVDWTPVSPEQAVDAGNLFGKQLFATSLRTMYLTFNLHSPKFANADFRSAIMQAINRGAAVKAMGGNARPLDGIVPTGIPGSANSGCGAPCTYNVDRAKANVAKAFPNGGIPAITIDVSSGPPFNESSLNAIVADLAGIGVVATIRTTPADQYSSITVNPDRELFQTSWSAAYPSSGAFLQPLFQSGSPSNVSGLADPKIDAGIVEAEATADAAARLTKFSSVEINVMNTTVVVPLATFPVDSVEQPRVRGIVILPTGNFDATLAWVTTPQP